MSHANASSEPNRSSCTSADSSVSNESALATLPMVRSHLHSMCSHLTAIQAHLASSELLNTTRYARKLDAATPEDHTNQRKTAAATENAGDMAVALRARPSPSIPLDTATSRRVPGYAYLFRPAGLRPRLQKAKGQSKPLPCPRSEMLFQARIRRFSSAPAPGHRADAMSAGPRYPCRCRPERPAATLYRRGATTAYSHCDR